VRPPAAEVERAWAALGVRHDRPARRVLYTWTTPEQALRLRQGKALLVKGAADGDGMSVYFEKLWASYNQRPWSRMLMNPPFYQVRYAWPHAWATRLGGDVKPYGSVLVQIKLKPEAIFAVLGSGPREAFYDGENRKLSDAEARKQAGKIGAVLHVQAEPEGSVSFREYVVCNEAMVDEWSIDTDEINGKIKVEAEALGLLARHVQGRPGWQAPLSPLERDRWRPRAADAWEGAGGPGGIEPLYDAALAFANERHDPAEATVEALLASMKEATQHGDPLTHRPDRKAPSAIAVPPPLPPPVPRRIAGCKPDSTFSCIERATYPCRGLDGRIAPCR